MIQRIDSNKNAGVFKAVKQTLGATSVAITTSMAVGVNELLAMKGKNIVTNIQDFDTEKYSAIDQYDDQLDKLEAELTTKMSDRRKTRIERRIASLELSVATIEQLKLEII